MKLSDIFDRLAKGYHPKGSVYITVLPPDEFDPNTEFGGTWVQFAAGKTLIGVNPNDADFNVVEKTGGAKTHYHSTAGHKLTVAEMPSHSHSYVRPSTGSWRTGTQGASHTWCTSIYTTGSSASGGNASHSHGDTGSTSNLNPYVTVYFWKRTA